MHYCGESNIKLSHSNKIHFKIANVISHFPKSLNSICLFYDSIIFKLPQMFLYLWKFQSIYHIDSFLSFIQCRITSRLSQFINFLWRPVSLVEKSIYVICLLLYFTPEKNLFRPHFRLIRQNLSLVLIVGSLNIVRQLQWKPIKRIDGVDHFEYVVKFGIWMAFCLHKKSLNQSKYGWLNSLGSKECLFYNIGFGQC